MDTNYQRSSDETSSALITRTIVRSSGNRTQTSFVLCSTNETRPRTYRVPDLVQPTEAKVLGSPRTNQPTVLIASRRSFTRKPVDACFSNPFSSPV